MAIASVVLPRSLFQLKDEPEGSEGRANWGSLHSALNFSQSSSRSRGGGNVGIGCFDFQGPWERRRGLFPVVFSRDRHFLRPLPTSSVLTRRAAAARTACFWLVAYDVPRRCR